MQRAQRLLRAAIGYHSTAEDAVDLPVQYASVADAVDAMRRVLLHEAHHSLRDPLQETPDSLALCTLDLASTMPGIVHTTRPQVRSLRVDATAMATVPMPSEDEVAAADDADPSAPAPPSRPAAEVLAEDRRARGGRLARLQRQAACDERRDAKTLQRIDDAQARREARARETPEEAAERRRLAAERRAERTAAAAAEAAAAAKGSADGTEDVDSLTADGGTTAAEAEHEAAAAATAVALRAALEAEAVADAHSVLPARLRVRDGIGKAQVHASPVPSERHLSALRAVGPRGALAEAVLRGTPSDALRIVQGPPGTGKSRWIVETLVATAADGARVLVCAPSNVAAAGIYERLLASPLGDEVSLCLPPERTPDGPVASTDPARRIVCATVSGRSGRALAEQDFDTVVVDEAAQCTEACTWTLLRSEVRRLVLVGDVQQLPAVVCSEEARVRAHGRSLMERLVRDLGYPHDALRVQHRMHPTISAFPNRHFYDGALEDAPETHGVPDAEGAYRCVVVTGTEERIGTSLCNRAEAEEAVRQVGGPVPPPRRRRKRHDGTEAEVEAERDAVILCPYRAQCRAVLALQPGVPVHTIDSFQGREADEVVLCVCRTGASCGFWSEARRLNVALTRARRRMVVVGAFDWTEEPLRSLAADARARGVLVEAQAR